MQTRGKSTQLYTEIWKTFWTRVDNSELVDTFSCCKQASTTRGGKYWPWQNIYAWRESQLKLSSHQPQNWAHRMAAWESPWGHPTANTGIWTYSNIQVYEPTGYTGMWTYRIYRYVNLQWYTGIGTYSNIQVYEPTGYTGMWTYSNIQVCEPTAIYRYMNLQQYTGIWTYRVYRYVNLQDIQVYEPTGYTGIWTYSGIRVCKPTGDTGIWTYSVIQVCEPTVLYRYVDLQDIQVCGLQWYTGL